MGSFANRALVARRYAQRHGGNLKPFQVPLSQAEIALDRVTFENWLANGEPPDFAQYIASEAIERQRNRKRLEWIREAAERDRAFTADLQLRILKQRATREGSPLIRKAMLRQVMRNRRMAEGAYFRGQPCEKCGLTLRFIGSQECIACFDVAQERRRYEKGERAIAREKRREERELGREERELDRERVGIRRMHFANRALAIDAGRSRFNGSPCHVCGSTLRYSRSDKCVACDNAKQLKKVRISPRQAAKAAGLPTFEGVPCKICGSTTRQTASKKCAACAVKPREGLCHG